MNGFFDQIWQIIVESNLLNVTGAILVLLIGYLCAVVLGKKSAQLMQKINEKIFKLPDGREAVPMLRCARIAGRVVYGVIMLLAVVGCLSVLKLHAAAEPLKELISRIINYLPNIAGALLLFFIAWVISELVKMFCIAFLHSGKLSEKIPQNTRSKLGNERNILYISQCAGAAVYLFFLPAILNALNIYGITRPLQSMFEEFLTFIPNIVAAAVILFAGLWAAGIARKAVRALAVIGKINNCCEKTENANITQGYSIAEALGWIVYILAVIPVVIAALTALDIDILSQTAADFFGDILSVAGGIAAALALLWGAVYFGRAIAQLIEKITNAWGVDAFWEKLIPVCEETKSIRLSKIAGKLAHAALVVFAMLAVCDIFEFEKLSSLINRFAVFGGNLVLSTVVFLIGVKLAGIAALMVHDKCSYTAEQCIKSVVIIFTAALAISNLELGGTVVEIAFALLLGSAAVAAAIAFGFGGRDTANELLKSWVEKIKK